MHLGFGAGFGKDVSENGGFFGVPTHGVYAPFLLLK
jgi:hypothetical protein